MAFKKSLLGVALTAACFALSVLPQEESKGEGTRKTSRETTPLIRKDLLDFGEETPPPSLRNIFRPKRTVNRAAAPRVPAAPRPEAKTPPSEPEPSFALSLNYIGSVESGGRTMALVVRNGEALPVAEGEELAPGYRVIRITSEEIEVEGPGGERKVFSRQGGR